MPNKQLFLWLCVVLFWGAPRVVHAAPVPVVAAESLYGDVAAAIGGDRANVQSVLSNPASDPHFFEARPSAARAVAAAPIVVLNGGGYDPWMQSLLAAAPLAGRQVLVVADLVHARPGANPHFWYAPATMPVVARAIAAALIKQDPAGAATYATRLEEVLHQLGALTARVAALRGKMAGIPVTATEPVFAPMAASLGLNMLDARFQLAVMNDTEPRASDVASMEADLRAGRVRALLHNTQVSNASAQRLLGVAKAAGVPVVGVSETLPQGKHYVEWMLDQLTALAAALHVGGA